MRSRRIATRARELLDPRFERLRPNLPLLAPPAGGWVRSIRAALGMSQADLAARLGVNQTTVRSLERSEVSGRVQLDTLRRAANALDCELVYAVVPRHSLQSRVDARIDEVVGATVRAVEQTMLLEDQLPADSGATRDRLRRRLADRPGPLWRTDSDG